MTVRAAFLAQLRAAAGAPTLSADLPDGATLADLVAALSSSHPRLGALLSRNGAMQPTVLAFVDDEQILPSFRLREGVEVLFLTPIAGGAA